MSAERRSKGDECAVGRILHGLAQGNPRAAAGRGHERAVVLISGGGDECAKVVPCGGDNEVVPSDGRVGVVAAGQTHGCAEIGGSVGGVDGRALGDFRRVEVGVDVEGDDVVHEVDLGDQGVGGVGRHGHIVGADVRAAGQPEGGGAEGLAEKDAFRAEVVGTQSEEVGQGGAGRDGDAIINGVGHGTGRAGRVVDCTVALARAIVGAFGAAVTGDELAAGDGGRGGKVSPIGGGAGVAGPRSKVFVIPEGAGADVAGNRAVRVSKGFHADDLGRGAGG